MDWLQPSEREARGSLVFAGGRGDFIEKYIEALGHWHSAGWNVTAFDWRGQGESRGNTVGGHLETFDPLVTDGGALLEEWIGRFPAPHVAIGHSMGGHLLLRIIAERRPKLAAAVLVAPMIGINSWPLPIWFASLVARAFCAWGWDRLPVWREGSAFRSAAPGRQNVLTSCPERYSDELWWFERNPGYSLGAPSWGWLSAAYASIAHLTAAKLKGTDLPILLIGTEQDRLVSPGAIRWAARQLPNGELEMIPGAQHEILRESDPLRLKALERIDAFLDARAHA